MCPTVPIVFNKSEWHNENIFPQPVYPEFPRFIPDNSIILSEIDLLTAQSFIHESENLETDHCHLGPALRQRPHPYRPPGRRLRAG